MAYNNKNDIIYLTIGGADMPKFLQAKVGARIPVVDKRIAYLVKFTANYQMNNSLIKLFEKSFKAVADQLEQDKLIDKKKQLITCIALNCSEYSFEIQDESYGIIVVNAIYPTYKWDGLTIYQVYACIIEEMCHFFWEITDELEVNFKVYSIVKQIEPNIKMQDLYKIEWMENELKKRGKTWGDFNYEYNNK